MKASFTLACLISTLLCSAQQVDLMQLDGKVTKEELSQLILLGENDHNQLLIDSSPKDYVRIVVKSEKLYVASLCVNTNNEIRVLHASAALGDITYKPISDLNWDTNEKFNWQMRETDMSEKTMNLRQSYLNKYGWVANTMSMGKEGETEFVLDKKLLNGNSAYLAIGLMSASDPENIIGIPAKSSKGCADHSLVSGDPKTSYSFRPDGWIKISY